MTSDGFDSYPGLEGLEPPAWTLLRTAVRRVSIPAGEAVFRAGAPCAGYVLVISGSVRVQMVAESGREIVLYRVEDGQTCILTTACLMASEDYAADAVAETDVDAALLGAADFHRLLAESAAFRGFVFESYGARLADLMALIDEVAFRRIDVRLAEFLIGNRDDQDRLHITHQELAVELGSAREVVSRQLKEFERRGWVGLGRGQIHLTDVGALTEFIAAVVQ